LVSSHFIVILAVLAAVGLIAIVIREFDDRTSRRRSARIPLPHVLSGSLSHDRARIRFIWKHGAGAVELQTLLGYPAVKAGIVMLPRGLGSSWRCHWSASDEQDRARRLLAAGILFSSLSLLEFSI